MQLMGVTPIKMRDVCFDSRTVLCNMALVPNYILCRMSPGPSYIFCRLVLAPSYIFLTWYRHA